MTSNSKGTFKDYVWRRITKAVGVTYFEENPERKLFELLGIENDYNRQHIVREAVTDAISTHLDVGKTGSNQIDSLLRLEQELQKNHPSLFKTEQKAWLTYRLSIYLHKRRRRRFLDEERARQRSCTCQRMAPQADQSLRAGNIIDLTEDCDCDDEVLGGLDAGTSSNVNSMGRQVDSLIPKRNGDINAKRPQVMKQPSLHRPDVQSERENIPTQTLVRANPTALQPSVSADIHLYPANTTMSLQHINSSSENRSQNTHDETIIDSKNPNAGLGKTCTPKAHQPANKTQDDSSTSSVKTFLSSCDPPMDHLLPLFAKVGCISGSYLQSIAKRSSKEREGILRKILGLQHASQPHSQPNNYGYGGGSAYDIDIWLLDLHLANYKFEATD